MDVKALAGEGRPGRLADVLGAALPHAVFAVLFAVTFERWVLPFHDHPREVMTAARLLDGDVLYRDVGWNYGPLPPYLDALALAVLGRSLFPLIALRTLVAVAGVEALRRLTARLVPDRGLAAVSAAFVVATCFFLGLGGTYVFPYTVAALEGTVGTWVAVELALGSEGWRGSLAAAAAAGLAAGAKLEFVPAALAGAGLALLLRRPRREAFAALALAVSLAGAAYVGPVLLLGREAVSRHGYLVALRLPETWRRFYETVFFGGFTRQDFASFGWLFVIFPSALLLGAILFLSRVAERRQSVLLASAFGAVGVLAGRAIPGNGELHVLLPFAAAVLAVEGAALVKERRAPDARRLAAVAVGLAALPALARQPFLLAISTYGAFSAPLALTTSLAFLGRRLRPGRGFTMFVAGLAAAQAISRVEYFRARSMERVTFARGSFYLPPEQAAVLRLGVAAIEKATPSGAYVAVFPEPGLFLFLSGRRSPFVDEVFSPGTQTPETEAEMIAALERKPPAAGLVLNLPMTVWGVEAFGKGYLERFDAEFQRRMRPVAILGSGAEHGADTLTATFYLPRR